MQKKPYCRQPLPRRFPLQSCHKVSWEEPTGCQLSSECDLSSEWGAGERRRSVSSEWGAGEYCAEADLEVDGHGWRPLDLEVDEEGSGLDLEVDEQGSGLDLEAVDDHRVGGVDLDSSESVALAPSLET